MARTKEKWSAELGSGGIHVVARHIEIPLRFFHDPERPGVLLIPLSKVPPHIKVLAYLVAKYTGTSAIMNAPDLLEDGRTTTGPDSE